MLGSLTVTHRWQCGASAGSTRCTWRRNRSGDPGRNQNSSPSQLGMGEVVEGDHGLEAARGAHLEDLDVAGQRGIVEPSGLGLEAGPLDGETERGAPDGRRPVQRLLGVGPEVARHARTLRPPRALPCPPSCWPADRGRCTRLRPESPPSPRRWRSPSPTESDPAAGRRRARRDGLRAGRRGRQARHTA